jgi:capsular exopolysaccharide synthesis family protein
MSKLITLTQPESAAAEAYRTLRTNLLFINPSKPPQVLLLTTPGATGEVTEKSLAAANLAVAFAQAGRKTLLLDCDLRHPQQHSLWNIANDVGIAAALTQPNQSAYQSVGVTQLQVLPAGPRTANPADLFSSPQMAAFLQLARQQADIIIIDAPPILAVTDAILLGGQVDGVLLTLTASKSQRTQAQRAYDVLNKAQLSILGAVLTNAPNDGAMLKY